MHTSILVAEGVSSDHILHCTVLYSYCAVLCAWTIGDASVYLFTISRQLFCAVIRQGYTRVASITWFPVGGQMKRFSHHDPLIFITSLDRLESEQLQVKPLTTCAAWLSDSAVLQAHCRAFLVVRQRKRDKYTVVFYHATSQ